MSNGVDPSQQRATWFHLALVWSNQPVSLSENGSAMT
jgi:hypothetical protein